MLSLNPRVRLVNIGPFRDVEVEVKPLTVFIGRNSVGKSFLAQMLWALDTTTPDPEVWVDEVFKKMEDEFKTSDPYEKLLERVKRGGDVTEVFRKLLEAYIETAHVGLATGLRERLEEVFERLDNIVMEGASEARIRVEGRALIEFKLTRDEVQVLEYKPDAGFVERVYARTLPLGRLVVELLEDGRSVVLYDGVVSSTDELYDATLIPLLAYLHGSFGLLSSWFIRESIFLPDSRAGVSRILLRPLPRSMVKEVRSVDREYIGFVRRLSRLAFKSEYVSGDVEESLEELLHELGCKLEVTRRAGRYTLYLRMWSGKRLHISESPSGVREALTVALALALPEYHVVFIEEPEAHLHPRAQRILARLIARAVNSGKHVVITTHSSYLLHALNNLVALHRRRGGIEKIKGFKASDAIDPDSIAAYLVKIGDGVVVTEKLKVDEYGIPTDEFSKVAEELLEEEAMIEGLG
jgi:predicted ATPase